MGDRVQRARQSLIDGEGDEAGLSDALDLFISDTLLQVGAPVGVRWCLLAIGGYGRREMAPGSDVDLLFLTPEPERLSEFVEACLHRWWDAGLKLGYATRRLHDALALVAQDHKTAMSLLDLRPIGGDLKLAAELVALLDAEFYGQQVVPLLEAIETERRERHARFGDTVFRLEPDIKSGEGGLRDYHGARWAARLVAGTVDLSDVGLTEREGADLEKAYAALKRFRVALHAIAGRRAERIYFSHQEELASRLGYPDIPRCMQAYWRAAGRVRAFTRRVLDTLRVRVGLTLGPAVTHEGTLEPVDALSPFRESSQTHQRVHPRTLEAAAATIPQFNDTTRRHSKTVEDFFAVLTNPSDRAVPLFSMHEMGLLTAFVPEFRCVTGLYQQNSFHVYTVDVHTLHGIAELKRLLDPDSAVTAIRADRGETTLRQVMAELTEVERRVLFLALLLHDTNKGGMDPSLTYDVALRLGLPDRDARLVEQLVRDHLLMALLAQTRDIHDETTQRHLAREVGDRQALALLYLLTHADMSSANPDLLTAWKASLLEQLYVATDAGLASGLDVYADGQHVVRLRRREVLERMLGELPEHPTARTRRVDRFFAALPTRYFSATQAEQIIGHIQLLAAFDKSGRPATTLTDFGDGTARITVVCRDQPGLLARHAGVLAAFGVNIHASAVYALSGGQAIALYRVRTPVPWDRLEAVLLDDDESWEARLRYRERPSPFEGGRALAVETRVSIDPAASTRYTVLDVVARDRPGLLYRVSRCLYRMSLDVGLARITTEGHIARDAFYVRTLSREPLDPALADVLVQQVADAIDGPLDAAGS